MKPSKSRKRQKEPNTGRSRSFGGCCRVRHMKCDEGKPTCSMCKHFGTACGGYEKNIFFTAEEDDGVERFRRPLLTDEERERMSSRLVSSIPTQLTLLNVLSQIDEESEQAEQKASVLNIHRGPFGVFKLPLAVSIDDVDNLDSFDSLVPNIEINEQCFSPPAFTFSPGTQEMFESFLQPSSSSPLLQRLERYSSDIGQSRIEDLFGDAASSIDNHNVPEPSLDQNDEDLQLVSNSLDLQLSSHISSEHSVAVPRSAVYLLKHYSNRVIGMLTPSRNTKTLWHVLFLPHVKSSLAALSMGEDLDDASLSSFYGTLAISAFHLKAVSKSEQWHKEGCCHKRKAQEHIRLALRHAYDIPKVAKYKSILMAILTMVQVSMFDGDWQQTECYFLEAEKFIRLRGLHRQKSRKRRLLHHCYAFTRILHESLFLTTKHSLQRMHVRLAVESSGLVIRGQDSPSFRLSSWRNLVQKMLEVKSLDEGENDLHLERPGYFSATMYPEIYGLPEEWLVMLSQVIRLGNEKDPHPGDTSVLSLHEFSVRAKDLEQCIINWHWPPADIFCNDPGGRPDSVDDGVLQPLLGALHQALIIYFYRRIYDIDASLLHKRVEKARDFLVQCDEADCDRVRYTSIFIWPAFIAACEAEEAELKNSFRQWFEDCIVQSGQSSFQYLYTIVQQVWSSKQRYDGSSKSWLEVMQSSSLIR